jgi:hypothetical protein
LTNVFISASNYGIRWEKSSVETTTQYKAFMSQEIKAEVGVNIGLRGINVTLKGGNVSDAYFTRQMSHNLGVFSIF